MNTESIPEIINGTITCPKCDTVLFEHNKKCSVCSWENPHQKEKDIKIQKEQELHAENCIKEARLSGDWSNVPIEHIEKASSSLTLTTSFLLSGQEVDHEIDIVTSECVYGANIFKDIAAKARDIIGGRSETVQKLFRDARTSALAELRKEAFLLGADGVIGVNIHYQELSGGGKNCMLMIAASGTAVAKRGQIYFLAGRTQAGEPDFLDMGASRKGLYLIVLSSTAGDP